MPQVATGLPREQKQAVVDAVLASETFSRSEQLRGFLRYVCKMEIEGKAAEITEYLIGVKALGRPADYSPNEDSSVRTRAYELRQRLQKYYATEGAEETLRVELPKGSYVPRFVEVQTGVPAIATEVIADPAPQVVAKPVSREWFFAVAGVLAGAAVMFFLTAKAQPDSSIKDAWGAVTGKDTEVLISVATPLHMLVSPYIESMRQTKYPAPEGMDAIFGRYRPVPAGAEFGMQPVQKAVTMGDVQALLKTVDTLRSLNTAYRMLPETNSPLTAMHKRSAILIGSPWYSRSVDTLLERTPWATAYDKDEKAIGIIGRGDKAATHLFPKRGARGEYVEVYGLVSVLEGEQPQDEGRTKVIFSGLTSVGVHGAAAFFSSARDLRALKAQFQSKGIAGWPKSYQVLVKCRASDDAQLLSYSYADSAVIR